MNAFRRTIPVVSIALSIALGAAASAAGFGQPVDGISCDEMEGAVFHIHQHLTIFNHGKPVTVPAGVGIPPGVGCLYWIHTHTPDGIIHVEAPVYRSLTLGNFLTSGASPLGPTAVASARIARGQLRVYVDGKRFTGDPRTIELAEHTDIVIEAGPPYKAPRAFTEWNGL